LQGILSGDVESSDGMDPYWGEGGNILPEVYLLHSGKRKIRKTPGEAGRPRRGGRTHLDIKKPGIGYILMEGKKKKCQGRDSVGPIGKGGKRGGERDSWAAKESVA